MACEQPRIDLGAPPVRNRTHRDVPGGGFTVGRVTTPTYRRHSWGHGEHQPPIRHHGGPVFGPVVVLTRKRSVELHQGVDRGVGGIGCDRGERRSSVEHCVGPEVVTTHVERCSWITLEILGLSAIGRDRNPDCGVGVDGVRDVGQLRSTVASDGGEDAVAPRAGELDCPSKVHGRDSRSIARPTLARWRASMSPTARAANPR